MEREIKNANGKVVGVVSFNDNLIEIRNGDKPIVRITDKSDIEKILNRDVPMIVKLYDEYLLTIAEIAASYCDKYFHIASIIKRLPVKTGKKAGRRNSSYAAEFSEIRKKKISNGNKGKVPTSYVRTQEIKDKISESLKSGYAEGRIKQDPSLKSLAWAQGRYKNVKMGRGIQGFFHSEKMNKDVYFRSLLELNYLLIIEADDSVITYDVEPFQIKLPHKAHYTPDIIINDNTIVELKARQFAKYTDFKRFCVEMACLNDYCNRNGMGFVVVYDKDIGFESRTFRRYIKSHPEIIQQYNIRFKKEL